MNSHFIKEKIAAKISQILDAEIPVDIAELDNINSSYGRLFYEGIKTDSSTMQNFHRFKFRWYDEKWDVGLDRIHLLENTLREAMPETFSDNSNIFHVRYYTINASSFNRENIGGNLFYCAELIFSIIF